MSSRSRAVVFSILLVFTGSAFAQTTKTNVTADNSSGLAPGQTFGGSLENVNYPTGGVNVQIPFVNLPGRHGSNLSIGLTYDSKPLLALTGSWDEAQGAGVYNVGFPSDPVALPGGWRVNIPFIQANVHTRLVTGPSNKACFQNFVVTTADGSSHTFNNHAGCASTAKAFPYTVTADPASNISLASADDLPVLQLDTTNPSDYVLRGKDGTSFHFFANFGLAYADPSGADADPVVKLADQIVDANGNTITITQTNGNIVFKDTLGRTVTLTYGSLPPLGIPVLNSVSYLDSSGVQRSINLAYATTSGGYTLAQPQPVAGPLGVGPGAGLSSITLPNGLTYKFEYNSSVGELSKITYPTGGYTRYDFATFTHFWAAASVVDTDAATPADYREVTAKHVCRDPLGACTPATEDTTSYAPTVDSTMWSNQYMDVTDPLGNRSRYSFTFVPSATRLQLRGQPFLPRELFRYVYQGSSTLLRTVQTEYNNLDSNGKPTASSMPIRVTTTLNDSNQVQKTEYDYDTDVFDNVIAERDYDFGIGAPGALLRRTKLTWLKTNSVNGVNYLASGVHILNRKLTDAAYDSLADTCQGQSRPCAQTTYEYDNYTAGLSSSNAVQHGSSFGATFTVRGNITAVQAYRNTDGASLTTRNQYDDAGNILSVTDPKSNTTTFIYADSWNNSSCLPVGGNAAAYISSTTNPKLQTSSSKYNSCTGTVASATDVNNQTTTFSYDALGRLVQTVFPPDSNNQHPQTTVTFNETSLPLSVTTSKSITSSSSLTSTVTLDGLGRMVKSELNSDPLGLIVDVTYDALGRKATESNPHRTASGPTDGIASFAYDAIGRPTQVTKPDNAIVTTTYYGTATQVADEGNGALRVQRISQTDGLGRMISVCEVSSGPYVGAGGASSPSLIGQGGTPSACGQLIAANGFLTSYTYDVLGNLLTTSQGGTMLRSFTYDSLSHLVQSVNPESGTISYTYDNNGNVLTRSDSRNTTITYSYDSLNRLTGKTYTNAGVTDPNTPPVTLTYDACPPSGCPTGMSTQNLVGRLVAASTPASALFSSYDALGRIKNQWQCTPVKCASGYFNLAFDYNLAGDLISESNGVGVTLSYAFDGVDRLQTATSSLSDANHPPTLVSNLQYGPMGVTAETLGNGATEAIAYTNRGQLQNLSVTVQNTTIYSLAMTYTPNGDALSANDSVNGNWTYSYDEMNRVVGASKNSGQQTYNYVYDRFGNRWQQNSPQGGGNTQLLTFTVGNNNRVDGYSYDAAGNQLGDGVNTFTYDVENRLHTVTNGGVVTTYVYDAFGRRIRKTVGSASTDYIYSLSGNAVAEVNGSGTWTRGEVFVGGKHVATYASGVSGTTYFAHVDWLGTERVHSDINGAACETVTSLIFGDGMATSGSCGDPSTRHFTGKERDAESGLDYFGARSYASRFGRFVTPDWSSAPVPVPYADLTNPQSLNLYALVRGNPSTFADLDGHLAPGQLGSSGGMGITPRMRAGGGSAYGCLDTGCDTATAYELTVDEIGTGAIYDSQDGQSGTNGQDLQYSRSILGQDVPVTIPSNVSAGTQSQVQARLDAAIDNINCNQSTFSQAQITIVHKIKAIVVDDRPKERTGIDTSTGIYSFRSTYIMTSSKAWLSTMFFHDAYHVAQREHGERYTRRSASRLEHEANIFAASAGRALGLNDDEMQRLLNDTHTLFNTKPY